MVIHTFLRGDGSLSGEISFRHNVMSIQSLDTFVNIRGGFSLGRKDVYFVRAIGECKDFLKTFEDLDSRIADAEKSNRIKYVRFKNLPNTMEKQASEFYVSAYSEWKQGKSIITRIRHGNRTFDKVLENATKETIEKYKIVRPSVSESMIRNFVIKLWYWTDLFLGEVIKEWSEQLNIKILSDNIVKPQEYLFCYFATLLGCDVLILNNRADVNINDKVRTLSSEIMLGSFGSIELPEHGKKRTTERVKNQIDQNSEKIEPKKQQRPSVKIPDQTTTGSIPKNENGKRNVGSIKSDRQSAKSVPPATIITRNNRERPGANLRQEKTFEELAQLACYDCCP